MTVKVSATAPRKVTEDCEDYGISELECVGKNCKGTVLFDDFLAGQKHQIKESNTSKTRIQTVTLKKPVDWKGLKNIKSYIHVLNKVK